MACTTCNTNFLLSGIDRIYYAVLSDSLDYLITGDTVILNQAPFWNRLKVVDKFSKFSQKVVTDSRGLYFQHTFDVAYSGFNSNEPVNLKNNSLVFLFKDLNDQWFISGYDQPLSIDKVESSLSDKNEIAVSFSSDSYLGVRIVSPECFFGSECDCFINIDEILTTNESYVGANDGTLTVILGDDPFGTFDETFDDTFEVGYDNLLYSINGIDFQESNVFYGLDSGYYTVTIIDKCIVGCSDTIKVTVGLS